MKQIYLIHEHHPRLLLFFAGWGADETPFKGYRPPKSDYLICYDYRTPDFDAHCLDPYEEIHVIGWSMGVWAAARTLGTLLHEGRLSREKLKQQIAINGTPFPIDEERGIPPAIYRGTLEGLTDVSLHKFLRRMCADSRAFRAFRDFLAVTPRRPLEELREELAAIERQEATHTRLPFAWSRAIVGELDRIIPPGNQLRAWQADKDAGRTEVVRLPAAHYDRGLFEHYLQELWTND